MTNAIVAIIMALESGPGPSDGGRAVGPLQIHRACVVDVNRRFKTTYRHADMTNLTAAADVCVKYLDIYGRGLPVVDQLRIWNGGPKGHHKKATLPYVERARKKGLL